MIGRGVAYRKTEETDLCWSATVETGVLFIGRGVAYRKTDETDLCWSARWKWGSCSSGGVWRTAKRDSWDTVHLHRRPPPASMSYCSSTVDLLQPPRAPVHPASTARYSTGYCSTTPPPFTVHPPLHRLLFIQPSTTPRGAVHPEAMPPHTIHPNPPQRSLFIPEAASIGFS